MARRSPTWVCQHVTAKVRCKAVNANKYQRCQSCGKRKPARTKPAHMSALDLPYEFYEKVNGGPNCGVCGRPPKPGKRHHRDHDHAGVGFPRGLACFRCNAALRGYMDIPWLHAAAAYLERANARRPK